MSVCTAHHLRGIHMGLVRVRGIAPDRLRWELGVDGAGKPFRVVEPAGASL